MVVVDGEESQKRIGAFRVLRRLPASTREVFLAQDDSGTQVVLKVFGAPQRNQGLLDPKIAEEASAYARLSHANIVRVVDIFSSEGQFVIAVEYVDGSTLSVLRAQLERDAVKVPDECWLYILHGVFAALSEAHAMKLDGKPAPVLHRGVNPSNVMIGWDGTVKLGNFNVAQSVRVARDSNPGFTWGSYGYFAPEQVKLEPPTPQSDVYSASLILWELLTGKKAIERGSVPDTDALKAMASPNLPPLEQLRRDLPPPVRFAVRAGLEPDPKRRVASAIRIRDVLRAATDMNAARVKLVELLARLRAHELVTVAPPAPPIDEPALAPAIPKPAPVEELISLMPDPPSEPMPAPPIPPPPMVPRAPVIVIESEPPLPAPAPMSPPAPVAAPVEIAPAPAPAPAAAANAVSTPVALEVSIPPPAPTPRPPVIASVSRRPKGHKLLATLLVMFGLSLALFVTTAAVKLRARATRTTAAVPTSTGTGTSTSTRTSAPTATATPTPTPTATPTPTGTVTATATATPTATVTATAPAPSSSTGTINLPSSAAGHRVFVDGRVMSDGAKPIEIACGHHTLRVGSHGKAQPIDVPCGGSVDAE